MQKGRLIPLRCARELLTAEQPDLLIDLATPDGRGANCPRSGIARACSVVTKSSAAKCSAPGAREADPVWPLPLWSNYDDELGSKIADLNNVSLPSAFARFKSLRRST